MRPGLPIALGWSLVCACSIAFCAIVVWRGAPLQTDLLALLPPTERNPSAERAIVVLNGVASDRAMFLLGHADASTAKEAARLFADALRGSGAFRKVVDQAPPLDPGLLGRPYLEYRFGLLSGADRTRLTRGKADPHAWLVRRLSSPFRLGAAGDLASDPFGLLDAYVADLPYRHLRLLQDDGFLVAAEESPASTRLHVLVSAELPGSAFDDRVQTRVMAAVADAERQLPVRDGISVLRTGTVFYASEARSTAQREMDFIALVSLAGITLLLVAVFRSVRPLLLGLFVVGLGLSAAASVALLAQRELHLLTLVFGASLIGEAIDYPIQYFAAHAEAGRAWEPRRGLSAVRPGLRLALLTSALGYAALWLMPFPAISQIALFALTGLTAAYISVLVLLPVVMRRAYVRDLTPLTRPAGCLILWFKSRIAPAHAIVFVMCLLIACAPGWLQLYSDDDVRGMSSRPQHLLAQEDRIRALTGLRFSGELFVVEGKTPEEVLQREEALVARLRGLASGRKLDYFHAVSSFVPSAARQAENRALVYRSFLADETALARVFATVGFDAGTAAALKAAWVASTGHVMTPDRWLASPAAAAYRHLWLGATERGYASIVVPFGHSGIAVLEKAAARLEGVALVDKAGAVSQLLRRYRVGFSFGLVIAVAATILILARRYGAAGAGAIVLPSVLGVAVAIAALGYIGVPVTLFSAMALMLVLGVGSNYAIFLVEGSGREGMTFIAVLLSATTTLLSFGLLAFSGTPALARFGMTLLVGVSTAVVLAPLALVLYRRQ